MFSSPGLNHPNPQFLTLHLVSSHSRMDEAKCLQAVRRYDILDTPPGRIRISVKDTGLGLPPEKLAQLFQAYNRLGQELCSEKSTGIGLTVTRKLVEMMEGTIGVESTGWVGSVFWIELISGGPPPIAEI
ncbi:ATP-binding protein [Nitrosospira sp. Is2]|uniref:ATP-binding protein n=1 Tax=Nitrosospira sp. Is2 TaxID=3080532 RepID=UPI0029557031|nr:ATP-binding protein [Nitrosospira sp. Is2]WON73763.1 ATP-binding protein [Nitrosospira sp. Is2]